MDNKLSITYLFYNPAKALTLFQFYCNLKKNTYIKRQENEKYRGSCKKQKKKFLG